MCFVWLTSVGLLRFVAFGLVFCLLLWFRGFEVGLYLLVVFVVMV